MSRFANNGHFAHDHEPTIAELSAAMVGSPELAREVLKIASQIFPDPHTEAQPRYAMIEVALHMSDSGYDEPFIIDFLKKIRDARELLREEQFKRL